MTAGDVTYTRPYPGGFRNKPDTSTPINARVAQTFDDALANLATAFNALNATVAAGSGGTGGGGTAAFTNDGTTWTGTTTSDDGTTWTATTVSDDGTTWTA